MVLRLRMTSLPRVIVTVRMRAYITVRSAWIPDLSLGVKRIGRGYTKVRTGRLKDRVDRCLSRPPASS